MIIKYLKYRLKPLQFLALAMFMALFCLNVFLTYSSAVLNFIFLFLGFIVFRFIDDAGSVTIDRIAHPDRTYLTKENYPSFLKIVVIVTILLLTYTTFFLPNSLIVISGFIAISICLYLIFNSNKSIMIFIPLLKYPTLLWCISGLTLVPNRILAILGSFFIMYLYDQLDQQEKPKSDLMILVTCIVCGLLIFQPWLNLYLIGLVILPVSLIIKYSHLKIMKPLVIIYYSLGNLIVLYL